MKINVTNNFFRLATFALLLISVLKYASPHFNSYNSLPVSIQNIEAKISPLEYNCAAYSINGNPVSAPAPTINNLTNGSPFSASTNTAIAQLIIHDANSIKGLFSVSGNPVFPHAQDSPRLHLACMVLKI